MGGNEFQLVVSPYRIVDLQSKEVRGWIVALPRIANGGKTDEMSRSPQIGLCQFPGRYLASLQALFLLLHLAIAMLANLGELSTLSYYFD